MIATRFLDCSNRYQSIFGSIDHNSMIMTQYDEQNFQLYHNFGVDWSTGSTIVSNSVEKGASKSRLTCRGRRCGSWGQGHPCRTSTWGTACSCSTGSILRDGDPSWGWKVKSWRVVLGQLWHTRSMFNKRHPKMCSKGVSYIFCYFPQSCPLLCLLNFCIFYPLQAVNEQNLKVI